MLGHAFPKSESIGLGPGQQAAFFQGCSPDTSPQETREMARAKRGFKARRRRNRIRKEAQGYRGGRSKLWKSMVETIRHAWRFATRDRRVRKRDFRKLWIIRINAAARDAGVRYSSLIHALSK